MKYIQMTIKISWKMAVTNSAGGIEWQKFVTPCDCEVPVSNMFRARGLADLVVVPELNGFEVQIAFYKNRRGKCLGKFSLPAALKVYELKHITNMDLCNMTLASEKKKIREFTERSGRNADAEDEM